MTERLDRIEAILGIVAQQQQTNAEAISRLETQQQANVEAIGQLTNRLDGLTSNVGNLANQLDGLTSNVGNLANQLDGLTSNVGNLTSRFDGLVFEAQRVISQQGDRLGRIEASIEFLVDAVRRLTQGADADRQRWLETQSEIRGLQAENRQILEYLFGQRRNGNGGE